MAPVNVRKRWKKAAHLLAVAGIYISISNLITPNNATVFGLVLLLILSVLLPHVLPSLRSWCDLCLATALSVLRLELLEHQGWLMLQLILVATLLTRILTAIVLLLFMAILITFTSVPCLTRSLLLAGSDCPETMYVGTEGGLGSVIKLWIMVSISDSSPSPEPGCVKPQRLLLSPFAFQIAHTHT